MSALSCPHCGGGLDFQRRPLSPQQFRILSYLDACIQRDGYAPSFDEIAHHFDFSSLASVHEHLTNMERKGVIHRQYNECRGITILVRPDDAATFAVQKPAVRP